MIEKAQVKTLEVGDQFEWYDIWFHIIGIMGHRHDPMLIHLTTRQRPLKPFTFNENQELSVRRKRD